VDARQDGDRRARRSRDAERVWFGALIAVGAVVIFVSLVAVASVSPVFCSAACHTGYRGTAESVAHAELDCDTCHADDSLLGVLEQRMSVVGMVGAAVIPGGAAAANVDNETCLSCHESDMAVTATRNGIHMNHEALVEANRPCQSCHPSTGHVIEGQVAVGYTMNTCLECHNAQYDNTATCEICHEGRTRAAEAGDGSRTPWQVTHGSEWRQTHGMGNLDTCSACHSGEYCAACHGIEMPHPPQFPREHGRVVLASPNGRGDCLGCHEASACEDCHGIEMPHPAGLLESHPELVEEEGDESCARCHEPSSCQECHTRHIHPGLTEDRIEALTRRPAQ
jgi:hypothetical protein